MIVAQLFSPFDTTVYLLGAAWVWHIRIISGLGCRESRHDTRQIIFSAPHPLANQLPATWLAVLAVTALMGSGALVRFVIAGDLTSRMAWMAGALFIPSLVLALFHASGKQRLLIDR